MPKHTDPDRAARRLRGRAEHRIGKISRTGEELAEAVRTARRKLARIDGNDRLSDEAKAADRRAVEETLRAGADEAERRVSRDMAHIEKLIAEATRPDDRDPARTLVEESRLSRAWERARRLLDAGEDPTVIAQQATEAGDRDTVRALREELRAWLQAQGRAAEVKGVMLEVEQAAAPLASPVDATVAEIDDSARRAHHHARIAIGFVKADGASADVIPGADGGLIRVDA